MEGIVFYSKSGKKWDTLNDTEKQWLPEFIIFQPNSFYFTGNRRYRFKKKIDLKTRDKFGGSYSNTVKVILTPSDLGIFGFYLINKN